MIRRLRRANRAGIVASGVIALAATWKLVWLFALGGKPGMLDIGAWAFIAIVVTVANFKMHGTIGVLGKTVSILESTIEIQSNMIERLTGVDSKPGKDEYLR